jgi:hypothetical protein
LLSKLDFDLENPRYEPIANQLAALAENTRDTAKLTNLMRHIAENGINPTERIAVMPSDKPGRFTVLEGNRRLTALKLLRKPQLLDGIHVTPSVKKAILRAIPSGFDSSEILRLDAVVFDDREESTLWIDLKHTGQNGGAGVVPWDGVQTSRYREGDAALSIYDFAVKHNVVPKDEPTGKRFPITTLRRLIGDPYVRQSLGIEVRKGEVTSEFGISETLKGLSRVVKDLASGKITVTDVKRKENRAAYADSLTKNDLPDPSKRQAAWNLKETPAVALAVPGPSRAAHRSSKDRQYLIPKTCKLMISDERLNKIYWELRRSLKMSTVPNAVAVLFRAFVEISVDLYLETQGLPLVNSKNYGLKFDEKISSVVSHLEANGLLSQKALRQVRMISKPDSIANPQTFHSFVHDRTALPTVPVMLAMWSSMEPLLIALYK